MQKQPHIGNDIILSAAIEYWADMEVEWADDPRYPGTPAIQYPTRLRVRDNEDPDAEWSQWITAAQVRAAFRKYICEEDEPWGVHPSWYRFSHEDYIRNGRKVEDTDYDAWTGDWLIQQLAFGEIVYG